MHVHAGHNHGFLGEWIESLIEGFSLPHTVSEFITHFIVDTLTIFVLLAVIMTAVYFISSYINMEKLHHTLARLNSVPGFLLAVAAGTISPFCSCSILPVLIGLISVGVPVRICLCYLTSSSLLNLTAILSVFAIAGPSFGAAYVAASLVILILLAHILKLFPLEQGVKRYECEHPHEHHAHEKTAGARFHHALLDMLAVLRKCAVFILLGVALSSAVMAFFSLDTITKIVNDNELLSTAIVTLIGLPIHSDIFSIAPVLLLLLKISPAVALTFTLSSMVISVPSAILLTRALRIRVVLLYCGIAAVVSLLVGMASIFILG